jgi:putative endonuclease
MAENQHISIGRLGEDIVEGYLKNRGFLILDRNYRQKWGELDILAQKDGVLHFVEVKAGSWNRVEWPQDGEELHRPEDHVHTNKRSRLARVIETYLKEKRVPEEKEWSVDLAVVLVNKETRQARVRWLWGIML